MENCPICKVVYKLHEGDIPHTRHVVSADPPTDEPIAYWEFTCPRCGFVRRRTEDGIVTQLEAESGYRSAGEHLAQIKGLGK